MSISKGWVPLYRFADVTGDGTGSSDGAVNASVTPVVLKIAPATGTVIRLRRMLVFYQQSGNFDADKYGNNIVLATGITIKTKQDGVDRLDLTSGEPVLSNAEWSKFCHDGKEISFGVGEKAFSARWTFARDDGGPLLLFGDLLDTFEIELADDFSALTSHKFGLRGATYTDHVAT